MILGKKRIALVAFILSLLVVELNKIEVPEGFENPFMLKFTSLILAVSARLAKLGDQIGLGPDISLYRNILSFITSMVKSNDEMVEFVDQRVNGINTRIYRPKGWTKDDKLPALIFYHAGAFCLGDLATYDSYLFQFVKKLKMVAISVEYRLAPENPYPIPTEDCFTVTKYVAQNSEEFGVDSNRLVLAGDSAGGNAVAVITQRFIKERISPMPKIQVLIYPWIQTFNFRLPSVINYGNIGILAGLLSTSNVVSWYLGLPRGTPELAQSMDSNDHVALIEDQSLVEKFKSYFDLDNIPKEYKEGRTYYEISEANIFPSQLGENHVLKKNKTLAELFKKLYDPGLSPFLADDEILIHSPVSYFIVIERDALKDEAILFSERLRKLGVHVKLAFYSTGAFHGMAPLIDQILGYQTSRDMQNDLIEFMRSHV